MRLGTSTKCKSKLLILKHTLHCRSCLCLLNYLLTMPQTGYWKFYWVGGGENRSNGDRHSTIHVYMDLGKNNFQNSKLIKQKIHCSFRQNKYTIQLPFYACSNRWLASKSQVGIMLCMNLYWKSWGNAMCSFSQLFQNPSTTSPCWHFTNPNKSGDTTIHLGHSGQGKKKNALTLLKIL